MAYQTKVHFAGMCLFVTDGSTAQVRLPNPLKVGSASHDPVLIIADHLDLEGTPDRSVTIPGSSDEFGVWSLEGRSLSFESDYADKSLSLDLGDVPPGWVPANPADDKEWSSLKALADIGEMGQTDALVTNATPDVTGPIIPIPFGSVVALPPPEQKRRKVRMNYAVDLTNLATAGTERAMADRIQWTLPVAEGYTTIKLTGAKPTTIRIGDALHLPIMISNVAAGACAGESKNHFNVYFEQVQYTRRPRLFARNAKTGDAPHYPEICRSSFFRVNKL